MSLNLDYLVEKVWEYLNLVRVYTKRVRGSLSMPASVGSPPLL